MAPRPRQAAGGRMSLSGKSVKQLCVRECDRNNEMERFCRLRGNQIRPRRR